MKKMRFPPTAIFLQYTTSRQQIQKTAGTSWACLYPNGFATTVTVSVDRPISGHCLFYKHLKNDMFVKITWRQRRSTFSVSLMNCTVTRQDHSIKTSFPEKKHANEWYTCIHLSCRTKEHNFFFY